MKRMTILAAVFLCFFGLTKSTAQNNQSSRNMEELNLTQEWDKMMWQAIAQSLYTRKMATILGL